MAAGPLDRQRPRLLVAGFLAVLAVGGSAGASHRWSETAGGGPGWHLFGTRPLDLGGVLLLLVAPAVTAVLLRHRVAAVAATVAACFVYAAAGYVVGPVLGSTTGALVCLLLCGPVRSGRWAAWSGLAALTVLVPVAFAARGEPLDWGSVVGAVAWACVLLLLAGGLRGRFERTAERRGAALAVERLAAEGREADAVAAERLRIARELHDVLAHSLSGIAVQAGVGLHLLDRGAEGVEQARSALTQIRTTSRDALNEVRAVLGIVRAEGHGSEGEGLVPRAPTWDLDALDGLVAGFVVPGGPHATLEVDVPADATVPPHLAGVAYRVVQESLTNVRRHAVAASAVSVRVGVEDDVLRVVVADDGLVDGPGGSLRGGHPGNGLRGMRERVEAAGGTLSVGARSAGAGAGAGAASAAERGFEVVAEVPLPRRGSAAAATEDAR